MSIKPEVAKRESTKTRLNGKHSSVLVEMHSDIGHVVRVEIDTAEGQHYKWDLLFDREEKYKDVILQELEKRDPENYELIKGMR